MKKAFEYLALTGLIMLAVWAAYVPIAKSIGDSLNNSVSMIENASAH